MVVQGERIKCSLYVYNILLCTVSEEFIRIPCAFQYFLEQLRSTLPSQEPEVLRG